MNKSDLTAALAAKEKLTEKIATEIIKMSIEIRIFSDYI